MPYKFFEGTKQLLAQQFSQNLRRSDPMYNLQLHSMMRQQSELIQMDKNWKEFGVKIPDALASFKSGDSSELTNLFLEFGPRLKNMSLVDQGLEWDRLMKENQMIFRTYGPEFIGALDSMEAMKEGSTEKYGPVRNMVTDFLQDPTLPFGSGSVLATGFNNAMAEKAALQKATTPQWTKVLTDTQKNEQAGISRSYVLEELRYPNGQQAFDKDGKLIQRKVFGETSVMAPKEPGEGTAAQLKAQKEAFLAGYSQETATLANKIGAPPGYSYRWIEKMHQAIKDIDIEGMSEKEEGLYNAYVQKINSTTPEELQKAMGIASTKEANEIERNAIISIDVSETDDALKVASKAQGHIKRMSEGNEYLPENVRRSNEKYVEKLLGWVNTINDPESNEVEVEAARKQLFETLTWAKDRGIRDMLGAKDPDLTEDQKLQLQYMITGSMLDMSSPVDPSWGFGKDASLKSSIKFMMKAPAKNPKAPAKNPKAIGKNLGS